MTVFEPDMERLLEPVSADSPTGASLRYEGTYDRIREARREDDASLPVGVWEHVMKRADWSEVASIAEEAITAKSKDLILAGWLVEAWTHEHGYAGLTSGLRLVRELSVRYWESLYPQLVDDDREVRDAPFAWLNEKLLLTIRAVPLTRSPKLEEQLGWGDWLSARFRARSAGDEDNSDTARFRRAIADTPTSILADAAAELESAAEQVSGLKELLDEKCDDDGPSLTQLEAELEEIKGWLVRYADLGAVTTEPAADLAPAPTPNNRDMITEEGPMKLETRADAYHALSEVADFLEQVEPHSPTPYLLRRAVAWGGLTLSELYQEFVREGLDLDAVCRLLAIHPQGSGGDV